MESSAGVDRLGPQPNAPAGDPSDAADGLLIRGDADLLDAALIRKASGWRPLRPALSRDRWLPRLEQRLTDRAGLLGSDEVAACHQALADLSRFTLQEFSAVIVRSGTGSGDPATGWLLGFSTQFPANSPVPAARLVSRLRERFGESVVALASGLLDYLGGDALLEAFLEPALSGYLGHRRTRAVLDTVFADSCHPGTDLGSVSSAIPMHGHRGGHLVNVVLSLVAGQLAERSTVPVVIRPVRGWHLGGGTEVIDEARTNGLAVLTGMPGIGKSSGLHQYRLPRLDGRAADEAALNAFLQLHRGEVVVIDSFYRLTVPLDSMTVAARAARTPLILISRPPADLWKRLELVRNWNGGPPAIFRVEIRTPIELRQKIEADLQSTATRFSMPIDWDELFALSGGNSRIAWSLLALATAFGIPVARENLERLYRATEAVDPASRLHDLGPFRVAWFTSLAEECRDKLSPFADSSALLKQIALHPVAGPGLSEFTEQEQTMLRRLLDYGVLTADSSDRRLRLAGGIFERFLREADAATLWRHKRRRLGA